MPALTAALHAWGTPAFDATLTRELRALPSGSLPLHLGVTQGGYVDDSDLGCTVLGCDDDPTTLRVRIGVFFTEIVINCGCGADPMPQNAYCELCVAIDRATADARFTLIRD